MHDVANSISKQYYTHTHTYSNAHDDESQIVLINEVDLSSEVPTGGSVIQQQLPLINKLIAAPTHSLSHSPHNSITKCFGPYMNSKVGTQAVCQLYLKFISTIIFKQGDKLWLVSEFLPYTICLHDLVRQVLNHYIIINSCMPYIFFHF